MMDIARIVRSALEQTGLTWRSSSFILADRCYPGRGNHILFVFLDGAATPGLVIKVASDPDRAEALRQETLNLARIAASASQAFIRTVPAVLHQGKVDDKVVQVQTTMPGATMTRQPGAYFSARRFTQDLRGLLGWLVALAGEPLEDLPVAAEARGPHGPAEAVAVFRERHRQSARLDVLLDRTCAQLTEQPPPRVPRHGDFCAANVMVARPGQIGVIDWEAPLERTWPLADLVYFLASVPAAPIGAGGQRWLDGYRRLLFGKHPGVQQLQEPIRDAVRSAGLAPEATVGLSAMAWVVFANRKQAELDAMQARSGVRLNDEEHLPLINLEAGHCLNLELLAEQRQDYLLSRP